MSTNNPFHIRWVAGISVSVAALIVLFHPTSLTLAKAFRLAGTPMPTRVPDQILPVPVDPQDRALSCEAAAAAMAAQFYFG